MIVIRLNYRKLWLLAVFFMLFQFATSQQIPLNTWQYIAIDSTRSKEVYYKGQTCPGWVGLDFKDINDDGFKDVVAGRYFYLNPGGDMTGIWQRTDFGFNFDAFMFIDVDDDEYADLIAQHLPYVYWLEADNLLGTSWKAKKIAKLPKTLKTNAHGYQKVQLMPGNKPEILLAAGHGIYCAKVPANPYKSEWPFTRVVNTDSYKGFACADIDGDDLPDIIAGCMNSEDMPTQLNWYPNPGRMYEDWDARRVGVAMHAIDRIAAADFNSDGMMDIAVSESRGESGQPDAFLYWFEQKKLEKDKWKKHVIATGFSLNNLDCADIDKDGDQDMITGEHKGLAHKIMIWLNDGNGNFEQVVVKPGKESYMGTRLVDMDNDDDLDIISNTWDDLKFLHLWRNDN